MTRKKTSKRKPARKKTRRSRRRKPTLLRGLLVRGLILAGVALTALVVYLDVTVRRQFEGKRWALPAHVYTRPMELFAGLRLDPARLSTELERLGYRAQDAAIHPGTYHSAPGVMDVHARPFTFWDGAQPAEQIRVQFADGRVHRLTSSTGLPLDIFRLEPRLFGSVSPTQHEDRSLVRLAQAPDHLLQALMAVEDRNFYQHLGVDPRGLARALWANLVAGELVQGGSTLTQQLVKNFYLNADRTVRRKLMEMIMAVLLEVHYSKEEILEAYVNEVYLGQAGHRAIHGFGLASQFYFGRPLHELKLHETALLVALVKGASYYNPRKHPQRARQRRDLVLTQMSEQGYISAPVAARAQARPLGVARLGSITATAYPAFLDYVRQQLRRDYRDEDLRSEGLRIFTTLDPDVQKAVEQSIATRLTQIESHRGLVSNSLEAAAVVVRSDNGEVLAVAGGRRARFAGFNRALDARRPVGSLIKPAVYLTALESGGRYTLASVLEDRPLTVEQPGAPLWQPQNYDRRYRGEVLMVDALVHSYNVPTARLGMAVGIREVVGTLERLGIVENLEPYPSLLLGATDQSPIDMARMYLTFASGGFRLPLKATRSVMTNDERPLARYPLAIEQVVEPAPMMLLNHALQEVVRSGTASSLSGRFPAALALAGKTGTTDGFRDSWFAGYSGNYLAVVWVGRDDNQPTGLTGASGAMQVWADIMSKLDLAPLRMPPPEDVEMVEVDDKGRYADGCRQALSLPFISGSEPQERAPCASLASTRKVGGSIKRFFQHLFGDGDE